VSLLWACCATGSIWSSARSTSSPELCRIAFRYPFIRLARRRITAETAASNIPMLRIQRRLGFVQEGVKRGAAMDGGDAIIFGMLRDECRWLEVSP
jgi:RimJ/RimL family protein N-acetyltransferase